MKDIIKNMLKTFIISYTIISVFMVVYSRVEYYKMYINTIEPVLHQQEENQEQYASSTTEKTITYLTGYTQGKMREVERNEKIIYISIIIGLLGGTITSMYKNKKEDKANDK